MKVDIKGYEGLYQIDSEGDVYSLMSNIILKQRNCTQVEYVSMALERLNYEKFNI